MSDAKVKAEAVASWPYWYNRLARRKSESGEKPSETPLLFARPLDRMNGGQGYEGGFCFPKILYFSDNVGLSKGNDCPPSESVVRALGWIEGPVTHYNQNGNVGIIL
jgi:hypothetical protein